MTKFKILLTEPEFQLINQYSIDDEKLDNKIYIVAKGALSVEVIDQRK